MSSANSSSNPGGRFCGDWSSKLKLLRYVSKASRLRLRFSSDYSHHFGGYKARVSMENCKSTTFNLSALAPLDFPSCQLDLGPFTLLAPIFLDHLFTHIYQPLPTHSSHLPSRFSFQGFTSLITRTITLKQGLKFVLDFNLSAECLQFYIIMCFLGWLLSQSSIIRTLTRVFSFLLLLKLSHLFRSVVMLFLLNAAQRTAQDGK